MDRPGIIRGVDIFTVANKALRLSVAEYRARVPGTVACRHVFMEASRMLPLCDRICHPFHRYHHPGLVCAKIETRVLFHSRGGMIEIPSGGYCIPFYALLVITIDTNRLE